MKIGYARVSLLEDHLLIQQQALKNENCQRIVVDKVISVAAERPELSLIKSQLQAGDELVVWRLDRLARSLSDLMEWMIFFQQCQVNFKSLQDEIDTTGSLGPSLFSIFQALTEFQHQLIKERTHAGLAAARAVGHVGGRRKVLAEDRRKLAIKIYHSKLYPVKEICKMFSICKATLYNYLKETNEGQISIKK